MGHAVGERRIGHDLLDPVHGRDDVRRLLLEHDRRDPALAVGVRDQPRVLAGEFDARHVADRERAASRLEAQDRRRDLARVVVAAPEHDLAPIRDALEDPAGGRHVSVSDRVDDVEHRDAVLAGPDRIHVDAQLRIGQPHEGHLRHFLETAQATLQAVHGSAVALQPAHGRVVIHCNDQPVTQRPRLLKVGDVTCVQDVEAAIGEHHPLARRFGGSNRIMQLITRKDARVTALGRTRSERELGA